MVKANVAEGRLRFTTDPAEAVAFAPLQFIAVGTPPDEDGSADLQYVLAVAETIGRHMTDEKVIINIQHYGNTSAATVPIALDEAVREGRIEKGKLVVLVAFGAGLTWGATLLRW